jgi:hypothetical protein
MNRWCAAVFTSALLALPACAGAPAAADAHADVFAQATDVANLKTLLGRSAVRIADAPTIQGRFEQRKYLADLPQPLVSTGEFQFARDYGVWWHTKTPFESVFVLTRDGMRNRDEGGTEMKISAAEQPGIAAASRIFFALFALDLKALATDFETFGVGTPAQWQIGLRPRAAALAAVFKDARLDGGDEVRSIELRDAHGDRTDILLSGVELPKQPLTPEQRARYTQ